jgi:hypothetical protein
MDKNTSLQQGLTSRGFWLLWETLPRSLGKEEKVKGRKQSKEDALMDRRREKRRSSVRGTRLNSHTKNPIIPQPPHTRDLLSPMERK